MARLPTDIDIVPAGFFAFRTPLLPVEELEAWNAGLAAPEAGDDPARLSVAVEADRELLRERLRAFVERPEIFEALFVASPSLVDGLDAWRAKPDSKKGRRAEETLVRYLQRMMTRATPFGLFAGCSVGTIGEASRLRLAPRRDYRRHTRLDMDYLFALAEDLGRDPGLRRRLVYRPNSSLYLAAGRWRYAEARLDGRIRSHHLVAVETAAYLEHALETARGGATVAELARAVADHDPDGEVTLEEAEEFVGELIESQVLTSELQPLVTGPEPIHELVAQLADLPEARDVQGRLVAARDALEELDGRGLGQDPEAYRGIARSLEELPTRVELPRLFQVDMVKPADRATLGRRVLAELERGVEVLRRLAGALDETALTRFCQDFLERYEEGQRLPLAEVLDEEVGVGFDRSRGIDASPLLDGLDFPRRGEEPPVTWGGLSRLLVKKAERAAFEGSTEVEITERDLEDFASDELPPLPDSFQVMATVAADSPESLENGDFRVAFRSAAGPSGAQLLGRFCHADPELRGHVESMLRREEARQPEAIFAEVVHLPEGRIGNILSRPVMRDWEIPFLGRGGADAEHRIPVSDLLVTVTGQRILLFSKRLRRPVIPRLTSAHNFSLRSLGVYRFLCSLQSQGLRAGMAWGWGVLESFRYLPRVVCGRLVLARARWKVERAELEALLELGGAELFRAVRSWRQGRRMPRRLVLIDADNELLVDFENVLSLETFVPLVKRRPEFVLTELFPDLDEIPAMGPEGRFFCELVVPFLREPSPPAPLPGGEGSRREPSPAAPGGEGAAGAAVPAFRRTFPPGSEWLYAKLYTGTSTADRLLADVVSPLAREVTASGAADHWYFIRYGDPAWHLRLRFHGEPGRLHGEVLPRLQAAVAPLLDDGRVWRFQLDTYRREVERYGGPDGVELSERLAHADSEAVAAIVERLEGDEGAAVRWQLAVRGIDQLLRDLGIEGDERMSLLERIQTSFAQEFRADTRFKKQLSGRLRDERRELEALLDAEARPEHSLEPGLAAFDRRSELLAPIVAELRRREAAGRLTSSVVDLAPSYVHMFSNRLIRSDARAHEVVLYDFLHRLTLSRVARRRKSKNRN